MFFLRFIVLRFIFLLAFLPALAHAWEHPVPLGSLWPDKDPALSADGRYLAFSRRTDEGRDLFLVDLQGESNLAALQLTTHPAADFRPSFTSDGGGLVFVSTRDDAQGDIYYLPLKKRLGLVRAGSPRLLLKRTGAQDHPALAADGRLYWDEDAGEGRALMVKEPGDIPRLLLQPAARPRLYGSQLYALHADDEGRWNPTLQDQDNHWSALWGPPGGSIDFALLTDGTLFVCGFENGQATERGSARLWKVPPKSLPQEVLERDRDPRQLAVSEMHLFFVEGANRATLYRLPTTNGVLDDRSCEAAAAQLQAYRLNPHASSALLDLQSARLSDCDSLVAEAQLLEQRARIHDLGNLIEGSFQTRSSARDLADMEQEQALLLPEEFRPSSLAAAALLDALAAPLSKRQSSFESLWLSLDSLKDTRASEWAHFLLAELFARNQNSEEALHLLQSLNYSRGSSWFHGDLVALEAELLFEKGDRPAARQLQRTLAKHYPERGDLLFRLLDQELATLAVLSEGAREDSLLSRLRSCDQQPAWDLAWELEWVLHEMTQKGLFDVARFDFSSLLAKDVAGLTTFEQNLRTRAQIRAAAVLRGGGRLSEGLSMLQPHMDLAPHFQDQLFAEQARWHLDLAGAALLRNDPALATAEATFAQDAMPNDWHPIRLKIAALAAQPSPLPLEAEEERLRAYLSYDPDHALNTYALGLLLSWRSEKDVAYLPESDVLLEQALLLDPTLAPACLTLSWNLAREMDLAATTSGGMKGLWRQLGRSREAFERVRFRGAMSSQPKSVDELRARAISLVERGLDLSAPQDKDLRGALWQNLGALYFSLGEYGATSARDAWEERLAIKPTFPDSTRRLQFLKDFGTALHWDGDLHRASDLLERAKELASEQGDRDLSQSLGARLGLLDLERGEEQKAIARFKALLASESQSGQRAFLHRNVALAYRALGEEKLAREALEKARVQAKKGSWPLKPKANWLSIRFPGMTIPLWNFPRLSFGEARVDWGRKEEALLRLSLDGELHATEGHRDLELKALHKQRRMLRRQGDLSGMLHLDYRIAEHQFRLGEFETAARRFEELAKLASADLPASRIRLDALGAALMARTLAALDRQDPKLLTKKLSLRSEAFLAELQSGSLSSDRDARAHFELELIRYKRMQASFLEPVAAYLASGDILFDLEELRSNLKPLSECSHDLRLALEHESFAIALMLGEVKSCTKALEQIQSLSRTPLQLLLLSLEEAQFAISRSDSTEALIALNSFRAEAILLLSHKESSPAFATGPRMSSLLAEATHLAVLSGQGEMQDRFMRWYVSQGFESQINGEPPSAEKIRMNALEISPHDSSVAVGTSFLLGDDWPDSLEVSTYADQQTFSHLHQTPSLAEDRFQLLNFVSLQDPMSLSLNGSLLFFDADLHLDPRDPAGAWFAFPEGRFHLSKLRHFDFLGADLVPRKLILEGEAKSLLPTWLFLERLCYKAGARAFLLPPENHLVIADSLQTETKELLRLGAAPPKPSKKQDMLAAACDAFQAEANQQKILGDWDAAWRASYRALRCAQNLGQHSLGKRLMTTGSGLALSCSRPQEALELLLDAHASLSDEQASDRTLRRLSLLADRSFQPDLADSLWAACVSSPSAFARMASLENLACRSRAQDLASSSHLDTPDEAAALLVAELLLDSSQPASALKQLLSQSRDWSRLTPEDQLQRFLLLVRIHLRQGRLDLAQSRLEDAAFLSRELPLSVALQGALALRQAEFHMQSGDIRRAYHVYTLPIFQDPACSETLLAEHASGFALCLKALGREEKAWSTLALALEYTQTLEQPAQQLSILFHQFQLALQMGRVEQAEYAEERASLLAEDHAIPLAELTLARMNLSIRRFREELEDDSWLALDVAKVMTWLGISLEDQALNLLDLASALRQNGNRTFAWAAEEEAYTCLIAEDSQTALKLLKDRLKNESESETENSASPLYLTHCLGLAERAQGHLRIARKHLETAFERAQQPWIESGTLREGVLRDPRLRALCTDLVELAEANLNPGAAWWALERHRRLGLRALATSEESTNWPYRTSREIEALPTFLEDDHEILTWSISPKGIFLLRLNSTGNSIEALSISPADLKATLALHQNRLLNRQPTQRTARDLYDALFEPFLKDVVTRKNLAVRFIETIPTMESSQEPTQTNLRALPKRMTLLLPLELSALSFAALQAEDDSYLVEHSHLSYGSTLGELMASRSQTSALVSASTSKSMEPPLAFLDSHHPTLAALPFASLEVESLEESFPTLEKNRFRTPRAWRDDQFPRPFRHFAGHATLDPFSLQGTQLIVHPDILSDSLINARDLAALTLPGGLLSLSACESALGSALNGTPDLSSAALLAGSAQFLGTLWKVDDLFASLLIKHFYRELARGNRSDVALALAQRRLLASEHSHPMDWAAFTLTGWPANIGDSPSK